MTFRFHSASRLLSAFQLHLASFGFSASLGFVESASPTFPVQCRNLNNRTNLTENIEVFSGSRHLEIPTGAGAAADRRDFRGKILHTRNRHLRNHRGLSAAFSNGFSVAFANGISHVSGISQRIVTCPVDCYWSCPMDFQWHFQMDFHCCEIWCVIVCPDIIFASLETASAESTYKS